MSDLQLRHMRAFVPDEDSPLSLRLGEADPTGGRAHGPIALLETSDGFTIIDGHRRLRAAAAAQSDLQALVYPPETGRDVAASIALAENKASLTTAEKLIAIFRTAAFLVPGTLGTLPVSEAALPPAPETLLDAYGELLERPVSNRLVTRLLQTAAWPREHLQAMHERKMSLEHILPLLDLSPRERRVFFALLESVRVSAAESKRIVRLVLLARGRKDVELSDWLKTIKVEPNPQGSAVVASLDALIRPNLTAHGARIAELIKRMKLPTGLKITAPENLEGDSFSCYFRFSRFEEYDHYLSVLTAARDAGVVSELVDSLNAPPLDSKETQSE